MTAKMIKSSHFFLALVLVFMLLIIGRAGSNPENTEWSRAVFFVS